MYFKILKKDIRRKKTMNIILLLFVILATAFIASSVNNLIITSNATNKYMEIANVQDFVIVTMNPEQGNSENDNNISNYLSQEPYADSYVKDDLQYLSKSNLLLTNSKESSSNAKASMIAMCYDIKQQYFFDKDNHIIDYMEDGTIYVPLVFLQDNNLKVGDTIKLKTKNNYEKSFKIVGSYKDALLGSSMMGVHRYLFSKNDFADIKENSGLPSGSIFSVKASNLKEFKNNFYRHDFQVIFSGDKDFIMLSYVMDMIIALVLIMVSVFLIIISITMLRFIIVFSVSEDYQEIGIMKAVGLKTKNIRYIYVTKYLILSIVGALVGFGISIPFGNMMLDQISQNMVMQTEKNGVFIPFIFSVLVTLVIISFAYFSTKRIKKMSPMDAIRSGNSGERFKRKGIFRLEKFKLSNTIFLAINDVFCEKRKYITLLIVCIVGVWLVSMPAITINTLRSEKLVSWFSVLDCDFFIKNDEAVAECINHRDIQAFYDYMDELRTTLEKNDVEVERIFMEAMFRYRVEHEDKSYLSFAVQGVGTKTDKYQYEEGSAPKYENELALAYSTAKEIDAGVGDIVYINMYGEKREFIVTALYQSLNNMGEGIRFCEKTDVDYSNVSGAFDVQVCIKGNPKGKQLQDIIDKVSGIVENSSVMTSVEFVDSIIGDISNRLVSLKFLILLVVITIIVLVVVLMQKMFLLKERGQISLLKAIGFNNNSIIKWQTKRIAVVLISGIILGLITMLPFSQLTSGEVFKLMGASHIDFVINPIEIYIVYPVAITVVTLVICVLTMLSVKHINTNAVNNVE